MSPFGRHSRKSSTASPAVSRYCAAEPNLKRPTSGARAMAATCWGTRYCAGVASPANNRDASRGTSRLRVCST
eukprot:6027700-Lingulodinium_polyedra.AAC.1